MLEEKAFSVVSNASPRCTGTCAHVGTTSLWGGAVATKSPAGVKKTKKKGPERSVYGRICSNPSGRILLKDDQNIQPAADFDHRFCQNHRLYTNSYLGMEPKCAYKAVTIIIVYSYQREI